MNTPPLHPRRDFLAGISSGFACVALSQLLARDASASVPVPRPELNGGIHHPAKVKRVIQLFMNGGASPMDLWDYKPMLTKQHGQKLGSKVKIEGATGMQGPLMKSPFEFKQHGQSGRWASSLFPEQAKLVDEMAFIMAMQGRSNVHGQSAYLMNNGFLLPASPAWAHGFHTRSAISPTTCPPSSCCQMRAAFLTTDAAASPPAFCLPCIKAP